MNKIDELCYKVYLTKKFQQDMVPLRARFRIPEDGFDSEKAYTKWQSQRTLEEDNELYRECAELVTKYHLPLDANIHLKKYVLLGTLSVRPELFDVWVPLDELGVCDIELSDKTAAQWVRSGIPFVRLIVSDDASQKDATDYIRSRWKIIQKLLDAQRGGRKKRLIRPIHNRALQEAILKLNRLSTKELQKRAKAMNPDSEGQYPYKEDAIQAILASQGMKASDQQIKKIITRRAKLRGH